MSAPPKPWEGVASNARASSLSYVNSPSRLPPGSPAGPSHFRPSSSLAGKAGTMTTNGQTSNPPSVPPRPQSQRTAVSSMYGGGHGYGGYSGGMYGQSYGGYGMGMGIGGYGGYGGYGSYGSQGMYGGRFGAQNSQSSSSFVRRAEESSRTAFQSIESIVHAFGSVAMMLESTHFAMHNSFRAVLGVADHFSRLKSHFASILGTITLFRALRYIFRKVMSFLGLRRSSGVEEEVWGEARTALAAANGDDKKSPKSWPIVMFFAVVVGAPWLIWKLLQSFVNEEDHDKDWMTGEGDHVLAKAEFDFDGEGEEELSFRAGAVLRLAPKGQQPRVRGWLLGSLDGSTEGIVPANYVKILGLRRGRKTRSKETSVAQDNLNTEPSTSGVQQSQMAVDLGEEYDTITEDVTENTAVLPSQENENSQQNRTLFQDNLELSDIESLDEGQS